MACAKGLRQTALCVLLVTLMIALVDGKINPQISITCDDLELHCIHNSKCEGHFIEIFFACQGKQGKVTCGKKKCREAVAAAKGIREIALFRNCTCVMSDKEEEKKCNHIKRTLMCHASG